MRKSPYEPQPVYPGDELISASERTLTHATAIQPPSETVWPWPIQMGAGRSKWYSYNRIANGQHSARIIIPALQHILVPAMPETKDAFLVREIHTGSRLILVVLFQNAREELSENKLKRPFFTRLFVYDRFCPGKHFTCLSKAYIMTKEAITLNKPTLSKPDKKHTVKF